MSKERVVRLTVGEIAYLLGLRHFTRAVLGGKNKGVMPAARKWDRKFARALHQLK